MMKCPKCQITLADSQEECPLCATKAVGKRDNAMYRYPTNIKIASKMTTGKRILLYTCIGLMVVAILVNGLTLSSINMYWSLIILAFLSLSYLSVKVLKNRDEYVGNKILYVSGFMMIFFAITDFSTYGLGWSIDMVLPAFTILLAFFFGVYTILVKKAFNNFFSCFLLALLISILPIITFLTGFSNILWLNTMSFFMMVMVGLGSYIYRHQAFKIELAKRFNI